MIHDPEAQGRLIAARYSLSHVKAWNNLGQAIPNFEYDLAPYVRKSFDSNVKLMAELGAKVDHKKAWEMTEKDVYQACEAFIHNSNSMHSRGGGQVPFVSINYGTDTSYEGRMIVRNMLKATQAGLGNGETPIFPE